MDKSPRHGTPSSLRSNGPSDPESALRAVAAIPPVARLAAALEGAQLYLVGGSVRDALDEKVSHDNQATDLDVATNLSPQEVLACCASADIRVIETGIAHGTVLAVLDGVHVEVTTFRVPSDRSNHSTADDITTDLSGRDFTINAIAFDVRSNVLVDPFRGREDLAAGVLRSVGTPSERFLEDPLRILRLVRFGPAQGRTVEHETWSAARDLVSRLDSVSVERIKSELDKILLSQHPGDALRSLLQMGALPFTIPELLPAVGFEQNRFHIHDVFEHTLWVVDRAPADLTLRWAAVFHDVGKPHTLSVDDDGSRHFYQHEVVSEQLAHERMKKLRFSHHESREIERIVRHHMRPLDCGAPGVRRILRDLGESFDKWRLFKEADAPPTVPEDEFREMANAFDGLVNAELERRATPAYGKLAITGDDLIALGMQPGPRMGQLLAALEELVLDDPTRNTAEWLRSEALKRLELDE